MGSASNVPIKSGSLGPRGPWGGAPGDGAPGSLGGSRAPGGSLGRAPGEGGPRGNFLYFFKIFDFFNKGGVRSTPREVTN